MKPPTLQPRLLSCDEAAYYLGMQPNQFRILRPSWTFKPVMLQSRPLWDIKDLDKVIDKQKELQNA